MYYFINTCRLSVEHYHMRFVVLSVRVILSVLYYQSPLQGGTGTEQALLMRLYLLQGIVAFHKGDILNASNLFRRVSATGVKLCTSWGIWQDV